VEMAYYKVLVHLMNRGMCRTLHNYNTRWEDKLERRLVSLGEGTFVPNSK